MSMQLTTSQALLKFLSKQYVQQDSYCEPFVHGMFSIFGHGNVLGLGEALENSYYNIETFRGNNEQGMANAAIAFAKQHRRLGIIPCTSSIGPGALNMVTSAGIATANHIPLLLLPGDTFSDRQPAPVLQQIEQGHNPLISANDAFKAVSVYWDRIYKPEMLMSACINALQVLTDPARTGAVTLCLPQDTQCQKFIFPEKFFQKRIWHIHRPPPEISQLEKAAALIRKSKKPLIIVGGGVIYSNASYTLTKFLRKHQIAMAETQAGKSAVSSNNIMNLGAIGVTGTSASNKLAKESDLIIAIGTKLTDFTTGSKKQFPQANLIQININRPDCYKMDALPIISDCKLALESLTKLIDSYRTDSAYQSKIENLKHHWQEQVNTCVSKKPTKGKISQVQALSAINAHITNEDTIICAAGSLPGDLNRLWQSKKLGDYHLEYGFSCMGYEVAAGLGVALSKRVSNSKGHAYVVVGDGSYIMLHSEILTALSMSLPFTIVLFDNEGYQCINQLQKGHGSKGFKTERLKENNQPLKVDFESYSRSLGISSHKATTIEELKSYLTKSSNSNKPYVITLDVCKESMTPGFDSWWRTDCAETSINKSFEQCSKDTKENLLFALEY